MQAAVGAHTFNKAHPQRVRIKQVRVPLTRETRSCLIQSYLLDLKGVSPAAKA